MVTLIKYGALSGGEKYNVNQMYIDGLSTDAKPTTTIDGMGIPNGSVFTEVDTGKTYMFDEVGKNWYEVSIGGGGTSGGIKLVGETTTPLTDGATTNPITVDGQSYTAQPNDAVLYNTKEFLFDGTKWHEFGDMTGLGTAAFEDVPTSGDASTTQVVMGNDSRLGKMARIIMDSTETQDYYMQDSTPSNPQEGDYWFSDESIVSSDISAMTGYAKAQSASAISATDTLNEAVGKLEKALDGKQATIDANNKLSSDLVDDSNATHKFATAAQLSQIETNKNNISTCKEFTDNATIDSNRKLYISATEPTGTIPQGSTWINGKTIKSMERTDNMQNESAIITGTRIKSDGTIASSGASNISDYIDVGTATDITVSYTIVGTLSSNTPRVVAFYDETETFISYTEYTPTTTTNTFTVAANAKYINITYDKNITNIMVNSGTTAESYVPYLAWQ